MENEAEQKSYPGLSTEQKPRSFDSGVNQFDWKDDPFAGQNKKGESAYHNPILLYILPIFIFNAILILYVLQAVQIQDLKSQYKKTRYKIRSALLQSDELRLKIAKKLSFARIEKIAIEEFGMKPLRDNVKQNRIFYLELPDYNKHSFQKNFRKNEIKKPHPKTSF